MLNYIKNNFFLFVSLFVSLFFVFSYKNTYEISYLKFSDSAKFADVARNLYEDGILGKSFTFFDSKLQTLGDEGLFSIKGIPILNPLVVYLSFKAFGVSDFSVYFVSMLFFVLSSVFIYLLGKKVSGNLVGLVASIIFSTNLDMINYAISGSSESLFIFEILLATYLISLTKKWSTVLSLFVFIAMYFTRPQAFVFIFALLLYWLILKIGLKKALLTILTLGIVAITFDRFVLYPLSFRTQLYSITSRGTQAILYYPSGSATSNGLRGGGVEKLGYSDIGKKLFYNLYNFYKLLPQIISPYIFSLFVLSLFIWRKENNLLNALKGSGFIALIFSFFVAAITIPLIRYIHPAIPFVILFASDSLVLIMKKVLSKDNLIPVAVLFIIFLFSVGQTLGVIFLDSRFEKNRYNFGKPPIYKSFAEVLEKETGPDELILTNLDTWGSWYGNRKTVWYPLEPKQIIDEASNDNQFDAIFLTSYLIDDENYYMNKNWRMIFDNPKDESKWICDSCDILSDEFDFVAEYNISPENNYEGLMGKAILLQKVK